MKLPLHRTHIAMFDIRQCQRAIAQARRASQLLKILANRSNTSKQIIAKEDNLMKSKVIAINPHDGFDSLAVWEKDGRKWHLLQLTRPQSAIALARENPPTRLVFPTAINPNFLGEQPEPKRDKKSRRRY